MLRISQRQFRLVDYLFKSECDHKISCKKFILYHNFKFWRLVNMLLQVTIIYN